MDDRSCWVEEQLGAAARRIHDTLTALSKNQDAHGRTDTYRAGAGDIFLADPDPQFFIQFTVEPEPVSLEKITKLLRDHIYWRAMADRKPIREAAAGRQDKP